MYANISMEHFQHIKASNTRDFSEKLTALHEGLHDKLLRIKGIHITKKKEAYGVLHPYIIDLMISIHLQPGPYHCSRVFSPPS